MASLKNIIRNWQTFFPFLHDFRFDLQFAYRRILKKAHDPDFEVLKYIEVPLKMDILDVGANRGEALQSILMSAKIKDNQIYSFEPNPIIFKSLSKRFGKRKNVNLRNFGLGESSGFFDLYVPFYRKWMFDGLASFVKEEAEGWLATFLWNFKPEAQHLEKIVCKVETLDDQKLSPFFIKLDVQGFEQQVLNGGRKTLENFKPTLLIEALKTETQQFLADLGYQFFRYENGKLVKGNGWINTFCIHNERMMSFHHLIED